jgi:hypothetical protein
MTTAIVQKEVNMLTHQAEIKMLKAVFSLLFKINMERSVDTLMDDLQDPQYMVPALATLRDTTENDFLLKQTDIIHWSLQYLIQEVGKPSVDAPYISTLSGDGMVAAQAAIAHLNQKVIKTLAA